MKKLLAILGIPAILLSALPAYSMQGTIVGLDMLRKLIIINRVDAADRGGEPDSEAASKEKSGEDEQYMEKSRTKRHDSMTHFSNLILIDGAKSAHLTVEIGFGYFTIEPTGGDTLISVEVDYDADEFPPPKMDSRRRNGQVTVSLESTKNRKKDFLKFAKSNSDWRVQIGKGVIWSLELDLAACETRLELGGLKVEDLNLESGLSETQIIFSEPNRTVLERCDIETGVGSFEAIQFGNAAIRIFTLENGLGSAVLDFTGKHPWENLKADIESGLGSVEMQLPDGLPVIMQVETVLGSADLPGFNKTNGGIYRSISYREGVPGLQADISVGLGTINVIWVEDSVKPKKKKVVD